MSDIPANKLKVWAGLKRAVSDFSTVKEEMDKLETTIGSFSTFQSDLDAYDLDGDGTDEDITSFSEFQTYLEDNGWTTDEAVAFIDKIKSNFTDDNNSGTVYDEFENYVENQAGSYEELKNAFSSETTLSSDTQTSGSGDVPAAGIRTFDQQGITKAGVTAPAGSTEVYGREIHFSQSDAVQADADDVSYSNLRTDDADNVVNIYQSITISADISNPNGFDVSVTASLTEDGSAINSKTLTIPASGSATVDFSVTKDEYVCADYSIGGLSPVTVCWVPQGLVV